MKVGGRLCQDKLKQDGGKIYGSRPVSPKVSLECLVFPWLRTTFSRVLATEQEVRWQENRDRKWRRLSVASSPALVLLLYLCLLWVQALSMWSLLTGTWYIDLDDLKLVILLPQFLSAKIIGECHTPICASALLKQTTNHQKPNQTNHPNNNETLATSPLVMMWRCMTECTGHLSTQAHSPRGNQQNPYVIWSW